MNEHGIYKEQVTEKVDPKDGFMSGRIVKTCMPSLWANTTRLFKSKSRNQKKKNNNEAHHHIKFIFFFFLSFDGISFKMVSKLALGLYVLTLLGAVSMGTTPCGRGSCSIPT